MDQQSPIDLQNAVYADLRHETLDVQWTKDVHGTYEKDEHGFKVKFGGDQRQFITLGEKAFHLVEFHFHHPSEHWIGGQQQVLELHIVNQNVDDGTRVVLGVFIDASDRAAKPDLVDKIKAAFLSEIPAPGALISTNPVEWLPRNRKRYYRYEGSLTTSRYDENVSWLIFDEHLRLSAEDVTDLIKVFKHPARLPQPLNRRFLLATFR